MKSLEELKQIRDRVKDQVDIREGSAGKIRVVVGMATCGIAAGARPVLNAGSFRTGRRGAETASEKRDRDTDRMYRAVPVRADRRGV